MKRITEKQKSKRSIERDGKPISVVFVELNPDLRKIPDRELVVVREKNKYLKWAYMMCPSGCGETLMMSLQKGDHPRWRLKIDKEGRPSLFPSVWKKDGCKSHFFLTRGKIVYVTSRSRRFFVTRASTKEND